MQSCKKSTCNSLDTIVFNCCNKECCTAYSNKQIVNILYEIDVYITKLSKSRIGNITLGYKCRDDVESLIQKLTAYKMVLGSFRKSLLLGHRFYLCLCKIDKLISRIVKLLGKPCKDECRKDLQVEERANWILYNPYCVARELWEKAAYQVCGELHMDVEITSSEDVCNITHEMINKTLPCEILAAISVYAKACEMTANVDITSPVCTLTFDVNKSETECKLKYDQLIKDTSCDLSFTKYKKLLDCKLNHSIIADIYGAKLQLDVIDNKAHIVTATNSYNICELKFTEISSTECKLLNFKPALEKYLDSYKL